MSGSKEVQLLDGDAEFNLLNTLNLNVNLSELIKEIKDAKTLSDKGTLKEDGRTVNKEAALELLLINISKKILSGSTNRKSKRKSSNIITNLK